MNRAAEQGHHLQAKARARGQALKGQAGKGCCGGQDMWAALRHGHHWWWKGMCRIWSGKR